MTNKTVSVVITSCDRFDLLKYTLDSFFEFNTYKINQIIIIEDSGKEDKLNKLISNYENHEFIILINKEKLGQLKSIDKAYSYVNSDYIFHCEDDWTFTKKSFIEKSLTILEEKSDILSVWIRDINEFPNIRFSEKVFKSSLNDKYKYAFDEILSFNPSLRRTKDYKTIVSYSRFKSRGFEIEISDFYKNLDYKSVILMEHFVEHEGWHRRVANINKNKSKLGASMDNYIKKIKASFYKRFSLGKFKNNIK